jgi:hypothetical protein
LMIQRLLPKAGLSYVFLFTLEAAMQLENYRA